MDEINFIVRRLTTDFEIKPFDCGDRDLNEFLMNDAALYLKEHLSVTYILENEEETVGYYSVQNDKISLSDFPSNSQYNKARRGIPRSKHHKSYPAVKVGRLAINRKYKGSGLGTDILDNLKVWFVTENRTGCRFMLVDAYTARVEWYERRGFRLLKPRDDSHKTQLMFYDLKNIFAEN